MTIVRDYRRHVARCAHPSASRLKIWPARANRDASRAANGAESRSAKVLRSCAARLLLRTPTDDFAFRRISRIDVRVLPIPIEHRWQDIATSPPPLPCADFLAVTKAQD